MKKHAPATLRNREAIAKVLAEELPPEGTVLEVASGSGEHVIYLAERFRSLIWQPSDPDPDALASISAYLAEYSYDNLRAPLALDACGDDWPLARVDAIFCANMLHISPWASACGLFERAALLLNGGDPLILYGPYLEPDIETQPSNLAFDASLKARNSSWGLRLLSDVDALAEGAGFVRTARRTMPANNLMLTYRRR